MICKKCSIDKSENDFYKHRLHSRKYTCKLCYSKSRLKYGKDYKETNYSNWLLLEKKRHRHRKHQAVLLFGGICSHCKKSYPDCVYDFHHIDGSTKKEGVNFTKSWSKVKEELEKCILLCANCHRIHHHADKE